MKKSKVIETLWTLTLLTIIGVGCFYLLLLGAQCYENVILKTNQAESERLPVSYIASSLRQVNKDQVRLETLDNLECLSIEYEDYKKLIYANEGELKEIVVKHDAVFSWTDGEWIADVDSISFEMDEQGINYRLVVNGKEMNMRITLR